MRRLKIFKLPTCEVRTLSGKAGPERRKGTRWTHKGAGKRRQAARCWAQHSLSSIYWSAPFEDTYKGSNIEQE